MSALDTWKAKAVSEPITLPSGTVVTLRVPSLRDCLIAGDIPLPILEKLTKAVEASQKKGGKPLDLSSDDLRHDDQFDRAVVSRSVVTVDGEEVSLSLEDVASIPAQDRAQILGYCVRKFSLPLAS